MGTFWKSHASDVYRLCYTRSFTNLFLGREVPVDARYVPQTEQERARLEILCYSDVKIADPGGRRYSAERASSRLPIQEMREASADSAALKRESIEQRLKVYGVQFVHLWEASRDQVNQSYRDAFEVLLAELCDQMGAYTGFVFESDAKQEEVMRQIRPKGRVIVAQVAPQASAQVIVPNQSVPQSQKPAGSS